MPMAAVQDVTYLPTTSKAAWRWNWRLCSWPPLPPHEAHSRVICRPFCCGRGKSGSRAPGLRDLMSPDPHPRQSAFPLTHRDVLRPALQMGPFAGSEPNSRNTRLALFLPQCPCHTSVWSLSLSVPDQALAPWAASDCGAHPLSWNKTQNPTVHPETPLCLSSTPRHGHSPS